MEVLRRCPLAIAQWLVHHAIALSTAVLDRVTKTMSVAPLLMNNLDNSKQKTSNLLSPAPPPYSWSLLGESEGPAPPPSSKISWSFDLAWNPVLWQTVELFIGSRWSWGWCVDNGHPRAVACCCAWLDARTGELFIGSGAELRMVCWQWPSQDGGLAAAMLGLMPELGGVHAAHIPL